MFAVLGEASSDTDTLRILIKALAGDHSLTVKTKSYQGGAELRRKGAKQLRLFADLGFSRFVVCHDADGPDPTERRREISETIVRPSGLSSCCIVVPVQELEAWILADIEAVTKVFTSWKPGPIANPELIESPKEYLERLSAAGKSKPRYTHSVHNARVAKFLDLDRVRKKCPSFEPLVAFVRSSRE